MDIFDDMGGSKLSAKVVFFKSELQKFPFNNKITNQILKQLFNMTSKLWK